MHKIVTEKKRKVPYVKDFHFAKENDLTSSYNQGFKLKEWYCQIAIIALIVISQGHGNPIYQEILKLQYGAHSDLIV